MNYCKAGPDSDVTVFFSHRGVFEVGAQMPDGTNVFTSVSDVATLLTKLEYFRQKHCKIPQKVFDRLLDELNELIDEERQGF